MQRYLILATVLATVELNAQQLSLDRATELVPTNNRVKTAAGGGVFALGSGNDGVVLQHISESGTVLWTRTLATPTLNAIDMDVDASDNIYIYVGFTTGQLDLDPGPNTTLVNPGKVYAKYNSTGQFQWGFSIGNSTDLSEDYGGISCMDAGDLYVCGDLGQGVYDFDFGPGVSELTVGDFSTGSFMARYRPDGILAWANIEAYYSGFSSSRDIAAMRDGSSFFVVRTLDNGGPLNSQIDVDYGPGVHTVYTETQHILRYDSALQFMAEGNAGYGDLRLCTDASGSAYMMARAQAGSGFWSIKFNQTGQDLGQVYSTSLPQANNLRLGDIAADEQGGCLGMYSNNGPGGVIRFYKMDVSGLVDFNLTIPCGNDYTYPIGKGFDLDGDALYFGTYNQNYTVDYDPGPGVLSLPASSSNDGVVARFDWCTGTPYDPFDILALGPLCTGQPATFSVSAFGDASSYAWTLLADWTITGGQGTDTITVIADEPGPGAISVGAVNGCGQSFPYVLEFTFNAGPVADLGPDVSACSGEAVILVASPPDAIYAWPDGSMESTFVVTVSGTFSVEVTVDGCTASDAANVEFLPLPVVDLGPDQVVCPGTSVVLNAAFPGASYLWSPGGETTASITVMPADTTVYSVVVTGGNGCQTIDEVVINVDPCMGIADPYAGGLALWPSPVRRGASLQVKGLAPGSTPRVIGTDGREHALPMSRVQGITVLETGPLAPGSYVLRSVNGPAMRFQVVE